MVREQGDPSATYVSQVSYDELAAELKKAGQPLLKESGMLAKLYPALNPTINELFFCRVIVFVEGVADVAYLTSYLELTGLLSEFRRCHCHLVPTGGKSEIIRPLAIAKRLNIPAYVVLDADIDKTKVDEIEKHKADNS